MVVSLVALAEMSLGGRRMVMGTRGRDYVLAHYERNRLSEWFFAILYESSID